MPNFTLLGDELLVSRWKTKLIEQGHDDYREENLYQFNNRVTSIEAAADQKQMQKLRKTDAVFIVLNYDLYNTPDEISKQIENRLKEAHFKGLPVQIPVYLVLYPISGDSLQGVRGEHPTIKIGQKFAPIYRYNPNGKMLPFFRIKDKNQKTVVDGVFGASRDGSDISDIVSNISSEEIESRKGLMTLKKPSQPLFVSSSSLSPKSTRFVTRFVTEQPIRDEEEGRVINNDATPSLRRRKSTHVTQKAGSKWVIKRFIGSEKLGVENAGYEIDPEVSSLSTAYPPPSKATPKKNWSFDMALQFGALTIFVGALSAFLIDAIFFSMVAGSTSIFFGATSLLILGTALAPLTPIGFFLLMLFLGGIIVGGIAFCIENRENMWSLKQPLELLTPDGDIEMNVVVDFDAGKNASAFGKESDVFHKNRSTHGVSSGRSGDKDVYSASDTYSKKNN